MTTTSMIIVGMTSAMIAVGVVLLVALISGKKDK